MYFVEMYESICEQESIFKNEMLKLESVHPIDIIMNKDEVLHEAAVSKIKIQKVIDNIIKLCAKKYRSFSNMTQELKQRNNKWLLEAKKIDVNKLRDKDFNYEIYPYWNGLSKLSKSIPAFSAADMSLYENENEFMRKYYPDNIDEECKYNKDVLRGLTKTNDKKIELDSSSIMRIYPIAYKFVTSDTFRIRDEICKRMSNISNELKRIRNLNAPLTESTLLNSSMFKDEYYDILIEAVSLNESDDIVTTSDIEKEEKKPDNGIEINKEENNKASTIDKQKQAALTWSKLCLAVCAAEMDILDEAYDAYLKLIKKVATSI